MGINMHDIPLDKLEGTFFQFESHEQMNCLAFGGPDWEQFKGAINSVRPFTEEESKSMDSDFLERIGRSKFFRDRLLSPKNPRVPWAIMFCQLCLHDWKPFLQSLRQLNVSISMLFVGTKNSDPSSFCTLTEMGAETLGWVMNPKKSGFSIETFYLYSRHTSRSVHRKWIDGMMPDDSQERIIRDLDLDIVPSWFLPDFVLRRNCKIQQLDCQSRVGDDGTEMISFSMKVGNARHNVSADANSFFQQAKHGVLAKDGIGVIQTMVINLDHDITPAACQSLSLVLSSTHIQELGVNFVGFKRKIDYDCLFKSVRLCSFLTIKESQDENENHLFPCDGLASWVEATSGISPKSLGFDNDNRKQAGLRMLLERADFSSLENVRVLCISIRDGAFSALCKQLGENKGPRRLSVLLDNKYCNRGYRGNKKDREALLKFGKSLRGNNKVKELDINIIYLSLTGVVLSRFFQSVREDAPAGTTVKFYHTEEQKRFMYGEENARSPSSGAEDKNQKILTQFIGKSSGITYFYLPSDDDGVDPIVEEVAKFLPLLLCGHAAPDGIWSHALSRTNIVTPNVMFNVLQQMPSCLQRNTGKDDNLLPMFAVPHHPSCPACQRNDSVGKVRVLQGRYCGERFVVYKGKAGYI